MITQMSFEFSGALPDGGALMGLDPGTKTIGTAFCDAGWRFASPPVPSAPLPKGGCPGEAVPGGFFSRPYKPFRRGDPCGRPPIAPLVTPS